MLLKVQTLFELLYSLFEQEMVITSTIVVMFAAHMARVKLSLKREKCSSALLWFVRSMS